MINVVPDTNVLIRGLTSHRNSHRQLINLALANKIVLYGCEETYKEFREKIHKPKFKRYLERHLFSADKLLADYRVLVSLVRPFVYTNAITRDKDDDIFFGVAKSGNAKIIVSEDNDLLTMRQYDTVRVVSTDQFLASYQRAKKSSGLY